MQELATIFQDSMPLPRKSSRIETTLYDLIEAGNEEVTSVEEHWVPLIVHQILESRRDENAQ